MKLPPRIISQLSLMICGDQEYRGIFPYRSSSYLTDFFRSINLPYVHPKESRRWWVQDRLDELNQNDNSENPEYPSKPLIDVIEQLVNPVEFFSSHFNQEKAIIEMNNLLQTEGFYIDFNLDSKKGKLKRNFGEFISTVVEEKKVDRTITFSPGVFKIPEYTVNPVLISVMIPFKDEFKNVYSVIKQVCSDAGMECKKADEIWNSSEIIQDVFALIFRSRIVIVDLSGENPNVFYEMGIAHCLGKIVIPLSCEEGKIPFDVGHHRVLRYTNSENGLVIFQRELREKIISSISGS